MNKDIIMSRAEQSRAEQSRAEQSRAICLDFLRVAAIFAVMILHVAANKWYSTDVHSYEWNILNFYHGGIVRFAVPSFIMISGALFLSRDNSLKKIFSKYIFRITVAFIFWSFIYSLAIYLLTGDIVKALTHFIKGHYHLWFLFMITGLYMLVPFLKKIAASEFLMKYFLVLSFIFAFVIPESVQLIMLFSEKYALFIKKFFDGFHMHFVLGFTGYFILGYYLDNIAISKRVERIIYLLGILGFTATIIMSVMDSLMTNKPSQIFYGNLTVNVLLESVAVFVFFKLHYPKSEKLIKIFRVLSQYTFGAYLVHAVVIGSIHTFIINPLSFNPLFSVPLIAVITFIISFIISGILNHIPVLKKYIV